MKVYKLRFTVVNSKGDGEGEANILCHDLPDAEKYLRRLLKEPIFISNVEQVAHHINGVTPAIMVEFEKAITKIKGENKQEQKQEFLPQEDLAGCDALADDFDECAEEVEITVEGPAKEAEKEMKKASTPTKRKSIRKK